MEHGKDTPTSLQLQLQSTMKQIIIILIVLAFSSCSSSKSVQTDKEKVKIAIDSTFNHTLANQTIEIEWILADDTIAIPLAPKANNPETKENPEITPKKIPIYGKIKIRITQDTIRTRGKVNVTKKKITKSKKKQQNQDMMDISSQVIMLKKMKMDIFGSLVEKMTLSIHLDLEYLRMKSKEL